ncbi:MAG: GNAT family N-acetyltransferase [Gemmataceae bacterium]
MTPTSSDSYTVRRFQPDDAPGISALVRQVYGDTYLVHPEIYHPDQIIELNRDGRLISAVAVDAGGQVVGHYALERPDLGVIAESGEAMVLPEHRGHRLLERMRPVLLERARQLGLNGVFGKPVTNHVYSQKLYRHYDGHPCGINLGEVPKAFHNMAAALTQRLSTLLYFQYLQPPERVHIHVPDHHRAMIEQIYGRFEITVEPGASAPPRGQGRLTVDNIETVRDGIMRVHEIGTDTADAIRQAKQRLCAAGAEVLYLGLPLAHPATPFLAEAVEAEGFFFSGIGPYFLPEGDSLRYQFLKEDLDLHALQIENSFARELLDYVSRERDRVTRLAR